MAEKTCKKCAMLIPGAAKICPYCRKPQQWTLPAKIFAWVLGLTLFSAIGDNIFKDHSQQSTRNVRVKVSKFHVDNGYAKIAGYIQNENDAPLGAEIKFTCYGADRQVLNVNQSWPASIKNIPAHSKYNFETLFPVESGVETLDAEVIDVRQW